MVGVNATTSTPTLAEVVKRDGLEPVIARLMERFSWTRNAAKRFLIRHDAM
jgi:hypothetical protein